MFYQAVSKIHFPLQQLFQKFELVIIKRRIPERQIKQDDALQDSLLVSERIKSVFAVISSHPTVSDTSERQMAIGIMHDNIIHAAAAIRQFVNDLVRVILFPSEYIAGQRLFPIFNFPNGLIQVVISDDRQ